MALRQFQLSKRNGFHCTKVFIFVYRLFSTLLSTDIFRGDWHRILVLDENLRDFVRNNLKITDRLMVNGEIIYNKFELEDGNYISIANILARRIQKLHHFKQEPDSTQPTQAPMEQ